MKRTVLLLLIISIKLLQAQSTQFEWAQQFKGGRSLAKSIKTDAAGNVYTAGIFTGTVDFNPGSDTYFVSSTTGYYDMFVCKLNSEGKLLWVKDIVKMGKATLYDTAGLWQFNNMTVHAATGDVYLSGLFTDTADLDPGPAVYNLVAPFGEAATFICRLNTTGELVWAKQVGGQKPHSAYFSGNLGDFYYKRYYYNQPVTVDVAGNVYVAGMFEGTRDFDPGPDVYNLSGSSIYTSNSYYPYNGEGSFVLKLDREGNLLWAFSPRVVAPFDYGNNFKYGSTEIRDICLDAANNLYCCGSYDGQVDFDPSANVFTLDEWGQFLVKLSSVGGFQWVQKVQPGVVEQISSITADANGSLYVGGSSYDLYDDDYT